MIIEIELPLLRGVDIAYSGKIKQLLLVISESVPFIPNISRLSEKISINRNTLITYIQYLEEVGIVRNLYKHSKGVTRLQKPDKIFLENPNLAYAIKSDTPDKGNLRETFFSNQVGFKHSISFPPKGDFIIDERFLIEIGGKNKTSKQIENWQRKNAFIAADQIEIGNQSKIPLWLFGFLY